VTDSKGNIVIDNAPQTIAAFDPNTAHCMTYMMRKVVEEGTGTEAQLWNTPVAGKTGTSGEYKDRWFAGLTPYYVAVVWTGYDIPQVMNVAGNPAAQLWKKVMSPLHNDLPWQEFAYPYLAPDTGIFHASQPQPTDTPFVEQDNGNNGGFVTDGSGNSGFTQPDYGLVTTPEPYYGEYVGDSAEIIFG